MPMLKGWHNIIKAAAHLTYTAQVHCY